METLQTLLTFTLPTDFVVIRSKLESEGIETFVKNELHVQVDNFASQALGGIELQVKTEDYLKARLIAEQGGFVFEKDESNWIADLTSKIPFINKLPLKTRIVLFTFFVLILILAVVFFYALITI